MYRLSDVAAAIDPENKERRLGALRNWFARGVLHYSEANGDKAPTGAGTPAVISRHTLILTAIAAKLADLGVPPEHAVKAAQPFLGASHSGGGEVSRYPGGHVFNNGETIMFVWRLEDGIYKSKIANIGPQGFSNYRTAIGSLGAPSPRAVIAVDCKRILDDLNWLLSRPF